LITQIFCALGFLCAMEYVFSPVRLAKAVAAAKATSEHHESTCEADDSMEEGETAGGKNASSKVAASN
jgi:hypothetical protein